MRSQCISRPRVTRLADDGNVVLGLAGHDAGAAADAGAQIDDHAPLMLRRLVVVAGIKSERYHATVGLVRFVSKRLGPARVRVDTPPGGPSPGRRNGILPRYSCKGAVTDRVAAFHRMVHLGAGQRIVLAGLRE